MAAQSSTPVYDTEVVPPGPARSVDLAPVTVGKQTFANPCFWILVGIGLCIGGQWLINYRPKRRSEH